MNQHEVIIVNNNRPNCAKHSYTQSIDATPEQVFPLLCPNREYDWVPGWETTWIISGSGGAEKDCIFQTPTPAGASAVSIWVVTRHNPAKFEVEMIKVTPEHTVGKLGRRHEPLPHNREIPGCVVINQRVGLAWPADYLAVLLIIRCLPT